MTFEIETMTPVRLLDVVVLSQKNRAPDEGPGAKLTLSVDVPNDALAMFDGHWLAALYTKNNGKSDAADQMPLDGVAPVSEAPDLTNLGQHVPRIAWTDVCEGYTLALEVDLQRVMIENCTCSTWRIFPKSGGTITVKFNAESNDVSEGAFGKLAKCKSREIRATLMQAASVGEQQRVEERPAVEPASRAPEPVVPDEEIPREKLPPRKRPARTLAQKVARADREARARARSAMT